MPLTNKKNIACFEIEEAYGRTGPVIAKTVIYNTYALTFENALAKVRAGEYDPNVLCIPKAQFCALFEPETTEPTTD